MEAVCIDGPSGAAGRRDRARTRVPAGLYVALISGLVGVALFVGLRDTGAGPWLYLAVGCYGSALSVIGARRMPQGRRRSWTAFAACQLLFLGGDCIWTLYDTVLHRQPYPSPADVLHLAMYPAYALGMWWLTSGQRRGRDRAAFLDAAILTTGIAVIGVVFFAAPAAQTSDSSMVGQVVAAAYPVGDLLLLALALRLLAGDMTRNIALWAIIGGVAPVLLADIYHDFTIINGLPYPLWTDATFLVSYVLLGFAPLHPSAYELSEPAPDSRGRITVARVSLLGVALVLAPLTGLVAQVTGFRAAPLAVFIGGSISALLVVLRLSDLVRDLQCNAAKLSTMARRDSLTGIANRRSWDHELARACAFAGENGAPLTVVVLDLDHFKQFNDTHGHLAGDVVLRETATAWGSIVEDRGFVARYGGEEFTALLPQLTAYDALPLLERMRRAVTHGQTCSVGVATWNGVEDPDRLMARADEALYRAKRSGRDRVALHHDDVGATDRGAAQVDPVLTSMRAVYQPIVDLGTDEVVGVEALSRFDGQDPRAVFDAAARSGTGPEYEAAALRSALAGWSGHGLLTINVSLTALATPAIQQALPVDLEAVVLEITETDLVDYSTEIEQALDDARARGALIAIDDFGVGFSNVHRVAMIRPDIVKLDMSLVRGIDEDPVLQAIARACLLFAELTGARLVAEGIETTAERDCVQELGVHLGQGYLFGRPGPLPPALTGAAGLTTRP